MRPCNCAAVRQLIDNAVMMQKRREMVDKYVSGEWGVELEGYEESQTKEEAACRENKRRWREDAE